MLTGRHALAAYHNYGRPAVMKTFFGDLPGAFTSRERIDIPCMDVFARKELAPVRIEMGE